MTAPQEADIAAALAWARRQINVVDARLLLQRVCQCSLAHLSAWPEKVLDGARWTAFQTLVARRASGEPVAYLIGEREFYGRRFNITPAVLIPRPETELLVELALANFAGESHLRVLDLGTGSGVLAITLALELDHAVVTAVDRSREALAVAMANAILLGARVSFVHSNWYGAVGAARFQLIVANPPYIAAADPHLSHGDVRFEPRMALEAGVHGLDDIAIIVDDSRHYLEHGGRLFIEHGYDQSGSVRALLADAGYASIASWTDLAGIERVSGGRWLG
ncbi:release factor glutamine methyltransferase [Betaproteobacteria bacterium]|nr:release factor glutamine methyltransferase [Betaproteobacteria bacterium]